MRGNPGRSLPDVSAVHAGLESALDPLLVKELLEAYTEAKRNYYLGNLRPTEVEGGRFCEAAFRMLQQRTTGTFTPLARRLDSEKEILKIANIPAVNEVDSVRLHVRVQSYRDLIHRHLTHPEAKSAGPDGEPCGPHTRGQLQRLHVHVRGTVDIGKESNDLEEVQNWLVQPNRTYVHYANEDLEWKRLCGILRTIPRKELAKLSGIHLRSIKRIVNSGQIPHRKNHAILWEIAERWLRDSAEGNFET